MNTKNIIEWIICIIIAITIAIFFKYFIGTPTIVKQTSMYPTLEEGDRLWLNKIKPNINKNLKRGEIVTFEAPSIKRLRSKEIEESPLAKYNERKNIIEKFTYSVLGINNTSYIKRVIALEGEHIEIKNGKVLIDDVEFEEEYLQPGIITDNGNGECIDIIVPENSVYVMGDNRSGSTDSRCFGCIPIGKIEGKVAIRLFPLNKIGQVK